MQAQFDQQQETIDIQKAHITFLKERQEKDITEMNKKINNPKVAKPLTKEEKEKL